MHRVNSLSALNSNGFYRAEVRVNFCSNPEGMGEPDFKIAQGYFGGVRDGHVYLSNSPTTVPAQNRTSLQLW